MSVFEESVDIRAEPEVVFDFIHDYSRRLEWDPFLSEARLLDGMLCAGPGVRVWCRARTWRVGMETVYVSWLRPRVAAVKMTKGPVVLRSFAASLRQEPIRPGWTRVRYRTSLSTRPRWLAWLLEPLVSGWFRRETRRRLACLKKSLERASVTSL